MLLLNEKQASKETKLVKSNGVKMDQRIHLIACSGLDHYANVGNGDASTLTNLFHAMPKSGRAKALKYWITKNANVKWSNTAYGGNGGFVKVESGVPATCKLEEAIATPFYEKPEDGPSEYKGMSVDAEIKAFTKRLASKIKKAKLESEENQAKCNFEASEEAMDLLLNVCDFEAVIQDETKAA